MSLQSTVSKTVQGVSEAFKTPVEFSPLVKTFTYSNDTLLSVMVIFVATN